MKFIVPYPAATCFGWSPSSGSSKPNSTKRILRKPRGECKYISTAEADRDFVEPETYTNFGDPSVRRIQNCEYKIGMRVNIYL
jgi:hypothetical protein